jgi:DNA-directed RNA polymerase subunit RPC12/RpoP
MKTTMKKQTKKAVTRKGEKKFKLEKRKKMTALMSSSLGKSPPGRFLCSKCQAEFGSSAALFNHVRLHSDESISCQYCGWKSDIIIERKIKIKNVKIIHGDESTFVQNIIKMKPIVMTHICNEKIKRRHCTESSYRTTKK